MAANSLSRVLLTLADCAAIVCSLASNRAACLLVRRVIVPLVSVSLEALVLHASNITQTVPDVNDIQHSVIYSHRGPNPLSIYIIEQSYYMFIVSIPYSDCSV